MFKNSQNIIFHEAEAPVQASANCKPGQAIYVITKKEGITIYYSRLSIGYRAYLKTSNGNKYGFTSCGHAIRTSIDNKVYTDTTFQTVLGTIKTWQYGDSVDASFIELSSGNNFVTTTYYSNENGSTSGGDSIKSNSVEKSLTVGATVYKVGSTTYKTSAIVTNTNYDFTLNGVAFTNFIKTTDFSDSGDSGGLVYCYINGNYCPAGLIHGGNSTGLFPYSIFCSAYQVLTALDIIPY